MKLTDSIIIIAYLILITLLGFWISKKKTTGLNDYFLGGKSIKWYFLGLSNGSGMFDVSGTSWMVGILFLYGVKSFMFMWLWPIWNQIFIMVFLAMWIRRSNIMTGSEWILTRFGEDKAGRASHIIVAVFAIVSTIGFIAYFFEGIGKFMTVLLPWDLSIQINDLILLTSHQAYALTIIALTTLYTVKGGMYSVVTTEVLQYLIMFISAIGIAFYSWVSYTDFDINSVISSEWKNIFFEWELRPHWDDRYQRFNQLIETDGYNMFGAFIGMSLFKGFFASIAGPTPSYDLQRILSTKSVKEAAYMSGFTNLILFIPRYLLIGGIVVIALVNLTPELSAVSDFNGADLELILPRVINDFLPVGLKGLLLAGLIAAFMSTFSAFVNSGSAYIVNDIYKKYYKPKASQKHYVKASYFSSAFVVILGVIMGFYSNSINTLTLWITSALYGGYIAANFLKWVWWRFNGWGYFWGMVAGLFAASFQFVLSTYKGTFEQGSVLDLLSNWSAIYLFPLIFGFSLLGSLIGTLATKPTDESVLKKFYTSVRPWGWWGPIYKNLRRENHNFKRNEAFWSDMFNSFIGIIWQSSMILIPIFALVRDYPKTLYAVLTFFVTTAILKLTWLDKIKSINE